MNILNASTTKEVYREWVLANYHLIWKQVTSEYQQNHDGGRLWLLDAANYLFQTAGVRWAIDPAYCAPFIFAPDGAADALQCLDLVLLTHIHPDHFDLSLVKQLCRREDLIIAVPDFMSEALLAKVDVVNCDLRIVNSETIITVGDLKATAFESIHFNESFDGDAVIGCDELGWMIEVDGKRIMMPVDVRNYNQLHQFPDFGHIDWLFAHFWLGSGKAISFEEKEMDDFCRFICHFNSSHVCFTHLYEISRDPDNYWTFMHTGIAMDRLSATNPEMQTTVLRTGQKIKLW